MGSDPPDLTPFFVRSAKELAKRLGVKCVIAPCNQYSRWMSPPGLTYSLSPNELVQYAKSAKYIFAGSFHGTVMGVIFKKQFLSLRGQVDKYESRPESLLRKIGLADRLVNPSVSIDDMEKLLLKSIPDCQDALMSARKCSINWLKTSIENCCKQMN